MSILAGTASVRSCLDGPFSMLIFLSLGLLHRSATAAK